MSLEQINYKHKGDLKLELLVATGNVSTKLMRVYCQLRKYFIYLVVQSRDPDEEYSIAHGTLNRAHVVSMKQDLNQSSKQLWEEELGGSDGHQVGTTRIEGGAPWTSAVAAAGGAT
jgi:hypothetical protein